MDQTTKSKATALVGTAVGKVTQKGKKIINTFVQHVNTLKTIVLVLTLLLTLGLGFLLINTDISGAKTFLYAAVIGVGSLTIFSLLLHSNLLKKKEDQQ